MFKPAFPVLDVSSKPTRAFTEDEAVAPSELTVVVTPQFVLSPATVVMVELLDDDDVVVEETALELCAVAVGIIA